MKPLSSGHRALFSVLGSFMFNYTAMRVFDTFAQYVEQRPYIMTLLGFIAGRAMMLHLLAYLYHVDTRGGSIRRDAYYDSMYA